MKKDLRDKKFDSVIIIKNLSIPQSIALEDMLATWQTLGSMGASRWTAFFADGDGNFRPKILYNGHPPKHTHLLEESDTWKGSEYRIDFDSIGWKLHDQEDLRELEATRFNMFKIIFGTIILSLKYAYEDIKLHIRLNKIRKSPKKCQNPPISEVACEPAEQPPDKSCTCDQRS